MLRMCQASGLSPLDNIVQFGSAAVIIFEHSFYVFDRRRYLQDKQSCDPSFYVGLEQYIASPHAAAVTEAVSAAVQAYQETVATASRTYEDAVATASRAYEEAVRTAVYPYEGNSPAWTAKLPFKPLKRRAKAAKAAFERSKEEEKESVERSEKNEKETSCYRAKKELIKAVVRITLNHRLPRP
ncbi:hypothetical protein C8R48DRAFT_780227 [Suillus tomentosus]|nr:hypothetical protein C8R48DRAFT_780227 [Suillus tomentosus]